MPFVPVPNTAQVNVRGTYLGEQVENTLYVRSNTAWSAATLQGLTDTIAAWVEGPYRAVLSTAWTYREVYAVDLASASGPTATTTPLGAVAGAKVGDPLPGNVSLCVSFRTGARGRSFRGRNYISGLVEPEVSGNSINLAFAEQVVLVYQQLLIPDEYLQIGWTWVVVSRRANNAWRTTGVATPVTQVLIVDNFVDSQRRRLPGRGR